MYLCVVIYPAAPVQFISLYIESATDTMYVKLG